MLRLPFTFFIAYDRRKDAAKPKTSSIHLSVSTEYRLHSFSSQIPFGLSLSIQKAIIWVLVLLLAIKIPRVLLLPPQWLLTDRAELLKHRWVDRQPSQSAVECTSSSRREWEIPSAPHIYIHVIDANKKLCYHRRTTRRDVSLKILPTAA